MARCRLALALAFTFSCDAQVAPLQSSGTEAPADLTSDGGIPAASNAAPARDADPDPGPDADPLTKPIPGTPAPDAATSPAEAGVVDAGVPQADLPDTGVSAGHLTAGCPVPDLQALFPGRLPPNPFRYDTPASRCIADRHDVIILLGCPAEDDGRPADCQTERVDMALRLSGAGYGDRFIVSGAAVHNAHVEAEVLADLLVRRGVDPAEIALEPRAEHTDENIAYSTEIMAANDWVDAIVVSDSSGHLIMTAVCDADCCVRQGRLTPLTFPIGVDETILAAHYVRAPWSTPVTDAECTHIERRTKAMCTQLSSRRACR